MWPCEGSGTNSTVSPNNSTNSNVASKSSAVPQDQNQTTPTWADRVRSGIARGGGGGGGSSSACVGNSPLGSSRPSPSSNVGTNKPQAAHSANGEIKRERKSSSSDRVNCNASAVASGGVDHELQTGSHRQSEKQEQNTSQEEREERGEKEGDGEGGGWETVSNSRNQSRINSATTVCRHDGGATTQSILARNLDSSNDDEEHMNEDTCKDGQPSLSSSSSEASPQHDEVTCELSASPPSQVDFLTSRSDDLSLANTDDSDSDQGLSIEDIASGAAGAQLLSDDDGEEEEEKKGEEQGVEPKDKSAELGGMSTLSQGLSQASDKVHVDCVIL